MPKQYANPPQQPLVPQHFYRQRKSSRWSVRLVPPKHLQHAVGKVEFKRSTGQADLRAAITIGMTMLAEKRREWEAIAKAMTVRDAKPAALSSELIDAICAARLYSWMKSDEEDRSWGLTPTELEGIGTFCQLTDNGMRAVLAQGPESKHWPLVARDASDWAADLGYALNPSDALFPQFIRDFARVESQASQGISKRNVGLDCPTPPAPEDRFLRLSAITELFIEQKMKKGRGKHISTVRNAWQLFISHVGDVAFDAITSAHVYDFMTARMTADVKPWSEQRARGFGARVLREVFGLARTKGWMTVSNPLEDMEAFPSLTREEEDARKKPRHPFTSAQLNELFCSDWYDPAAKRFKGKMRTDLGARYWVPLIDLFHGVRVGEGVQVVVSDFKLEAGVPVLSVRTETDSSDESGPKSKKVAPAAARSSSEHEVEKLRSLKNKATRRRVPVHPKLVELGILQFIEARRLASGDRALLFPSSHPNPGAKLPKLGRSYEQAFLRFVRDTLNFGNGYGNHSFRHQLEDRVRDAQAVFGPWPAGLSHQYTGRRSTRSSDRGRVIAEGSEHDYGNGFRPAAMLPYIERIDFSDIQLPPPFARWVEGR